MTPRPSTETARAACLVNWPDAQNGSYHPSCCRFPKSCSIQPAPRPSAETPCKWMHDKRCECKEGYVAARAALAEARAENGRQKSRTLHWMDSYGKMTDFAREQAAALAVAQARIAAVEALADRSMYPVPCINGEDIRAALAASPAAPKDMP